MSVINQMLKDLDKRSPEQAVEANEYPVVITKKTPFNTILISIAVIIFLNIAGIYMWQLFTENQQLKAQHKPLISTNIAQIQPLKITKKIALTPVSTSITTKSAKAVDNEPKNTKRSDNHQVLLTQNKNQQTPQTNQIQEKVVLPILENKTLDVAQVVISDVKPKIVPDATPLKTKMVVSRKQLTSAELIEQKLTQAENALSINNIAKAETLFEDILIIEPTYIMARKKLAALWFGRQSYGPALNLLSQGIAIAPQNSELRMMKARIHLKQGYGLLAYKTLLPMALFENDEYQIFLANIAQKVKKYKTAISAYQVLIKMQPDVSRWYLGLAIVYDKSSQFMLAVESYTQALTRGDLSHSSIKFAQQRMQALGE